MIWVVGSRGMLGSDMTDRLSVAGVPFVGSDREVDILDYPSLERFAESRGVTDIVNCSGYTAVDSAEDDEPAAFALNCEGPKNLAKLSVALGARLFHVSTDYVFDGRSRRPYREGAVRNPLSVYGRSKAAGEDAVLETLPSAFVIRTAWLYGKWGANFVYTMLRLFRSKPEVSVVGDQYGTPTWSGELAAGILALIGSAEAGGGGIYHFTGTGITTWYGFAQEILRGAVERGMVRTTPALRRISTSQYPTRAARPGYSALSKARFVRRTGFRPKNWKESLSAFLSELAADPDRLALRTGIDFGGHR